MSGTWQRGLALVAAIGAGTAAGVFFAFSAFVMAGLGLVRPAAGLAAMQGINRAAPRPPLVALLLGTAAASVGLAATQLGDLGSSAAARYDLAGALLVLVAIVLTGAFHIPRNDALGRLDADDPASADPWRRYRARWTTWNHARTLACAAAAALLTLAYGAS